MSKKWVKLEITIKFNSLISILLLEIKSRRGNHFAFKQDVRERWIDSIRSCTTELLIHKNDYAGPCSDATKYLPHGFKMTRCKLNQFFTPIRIVYCVLCIIYRVCIIVFLCHKFVYELTFQWFLWTFYNLILYSPSNTLK